MTKAAARFSGLILGVSMLLGLGAMPAPAHADVPGLQASPLEYRDALTPGKVKTGYVQVSNPGDGPITIASSVRGFRQIGTDGRLEFFDDPDLSAGIQIGLTSFNLGPREAVRVVFNVDPSKLPAGGVYAGLFFRTVPPAQSSLSSYVDESANVGTLLELTNGPIGAYQGTIKTLSLPFMQFGNTLKGSLDYTNADHSAHPVGFRPNLSMQVLPWGKSPKLTTGLVLPGITRNFAIARPGSYFGLLPVIVTDNDTHKIAITWIFACTGFYQWLVIVLGIALAIFAIIRPKRLLKALRRVLAVRLMVPKQ